MVERISSRPVHKGDRYAATTPHLGGCELVHPRRDPALGRVHLGLRRRRREVLAAVGRLRSVLLLALVDRVGIPFDTYDPGRHPGGDIRGVGAAGATNVQLPFKIAAHRVTEVVQLTGEGRGRLRVVEIVGLEVGLVRQVDPVQEIDRIVGMGEVVVAQGLVERGLVQGVHPEESHTEIAHLLDPLPVLLGGHGHLTRVVSRNAGAEVHPTPEVDRAAGSVQHQT